MPKFQNEVQKFRHRGYSSNDGGPLQMVFGDGPAPQNADGSEMKKEWDHDVEQVITIKDHQE